MFWGFLFIFAAILVIARQFGYLVGFNFFSLILVVFLASVMIKSLVRLNFFGFLLPLALITVIFREPLGIMFISPLAIVFAAILLSIGLSMVFRRRRFWGFYHSKHFCGNDRCLDENFSSNAVHSDDSEVEFAESFGSSSKYINSQSLKRADVRCSFGAMKIYFDNAKPHSDGAVICLDCKFSGVEMYLPRGWHVENNVGATLGGVSEKNKPRGAAGPTVKLVGEVSFGGIEIIYV